MPGRTVALVAGTPPGAACGVSDYTRLLAAALRKAGVDARFHNLLDWSVGGFRRTLAALKGADIVHLQHPATAFERRFGPYLLLSALKGPRRMLTLHEFSRKSRFGMAMAGPMIARAERIVTTDRAEQAAIAARYPKAAAKLSIVPIASNIPIATPRPRDTAIAHFGQIRGGKGIDTFLNVIDLLGAHRRACLIGSIVPGDAEGAALVERARAGGIEVVLDAPAEQVAERLAATQVCLLPFVDGISERRGSTLAAWGNGAIVVTTPPADPADRALFAPLCLMGKGVDGLAEQVRRALGPAMPDPAMDRAARAFVADRAWPAIAEAHRALYAQLA